MADLDRIFDDIKKRLGDTKVIQTLNDAKVDFDALPSNVPVIDSALDGGLPAARVVEIAGPEGSGKTTVMLHFIAAAQKRGDVVYYIDAEHALDPTYAARIGVNMERLLFAQPDTGEQALETARVICEATEAEQQRTGERVNTLIVIDSIAALVPKQEFEVFEKDGLDSTVAMGARARMLSKLLPPLVNKAGKAGATIVCVNQERDKIGVTWGSTIDTVGGRALKYYCSLRLRIVRIGYMKRGSEKAGIEVKLVPIKSKLFPIWGREANFYIGPNGIDLVAALMDQGLKHGAITKSGSWYKHGDFSAQGQDKLYDGLTEDPELFASVERAIADKAKPQPPAAPPTPPPPKPVVDPQPKTPPAPEAQEKPAQGVVKAGVVKVSKPS